MNQIERTICHPPHDGQLWLREESPERGAVEQTAFESRLAEIATDSEIQAELQELRKETYACDSPYVPDGLEIVEVE